MAAPNLAGPWGDNPWTCTVRGMTVHCRTSSRVSPSVRARSSSRTRTMLMATEACTTANRSVSMKAGFLSAARVLQQVRSRPTTCPASTLIRIWLALSLAGLCASGRFRSLGGSGTPDNCELCPPGTSSPSGATACTNCLPGMFNDYDILECVTFSSLDSSVTVLGGRCASSVRLAATAPSSTRVVCLACSKARCWSVDWILR